jgi:probable F420-dependent oxidoreductase
MFATADAIAPAELGVLAEEHGFESLFLPEHTHIPASRRSPYPGGGELPSEYWSSFDPFVALATVAQATERLQVGTGVCLVVERDPIVTAKEVASLDMLSRGRFLFGVGAGWNREEMESHGTDPSTRFALMRERIEAMKAIWTEEEAEYHGRHVDFAALWSLPKPVQQPHPPVLVGGSGPGVLDRVLAYGDEWMPIASSVDATDALLARVAELRERAADAGRGEVPVTAFGAPPKREVLERYAEGGIHRAVIFLPSKGRDEVAPRVERRAELAQALVHA